MKDSRYPYRPEQRGRLLEDRLHVLEPLGLRRVDLGPKRRELARAHRLRLPVGPLECAARPRGGVHLPVGDVGQNAVEGPVRHRLQGIPCICLVCLLHGKAFPGAHVAVDFDPFRIDVDPDRTAPAERRAQKCPPDPHERVEHRLPLLREYAQQVGAQVRRLLAAVLVAQRVLQVGRVWLGDHRTRPEHPFASRQVVDTVVLGVESARAPVRVKDLPFRAPHQATVRPRDERGTPSRCGGPKPLRRCRRRGTGSPRGWSSRGSRGCSWISSRARIPSELYERNTLRARTTLMSPPRAAAAFCLCENGLFRAARSNLRVLPKSGGFSHRARFSRT